jgi:hypothetical protein
MLYIFTYNCMVLANHIYMVLAGDPRLHLLYFFVVHNSGLWLVCEHHQLRVCTVYISVRSCQPCQLCMAGNPHLHGPLCVHSVCSLPPVCVITVPVWGSLPPVCVCSLPPV